MLLHSHTCRQTLSKTWVLPSRTLSPNPSQRREGLERQGDCLLNPPPALKPSPAHPSSTRLHRKQEQSGTLDSHTPQNDLIRKLISPWMPALWVHTERREGREWQSTGKTFLEVHWKDTWTHWQGGQKQPTSPTFPATPGIRVMCQLLLAHSPQKTFLSQNINYPNANRVNI